MKEIDLKELKLTIQNSFNGNSLSLDQFYSLVKRTYSENDADIQAVFWFDNYRGLSVTQLAKENDIE